MNLRQLEYFIAVAETGGFAAAGRQLNIAQSAVSRQIAELEIELQVQLFRRQGRSTVITPAGTRILEDAKEILQRVSRLKTVANQSLAVTTLMIGSSHSFGNFLFPRLSIRLAARHSGIAVGFTQGPSARLLDLLQTGELDLAVLSQLEGDPAPDAGNVSMEALCREQLCIVGRSDQLHGEGPISVKEALSHDLILLPPGSVERRSYENLARAHKVEIKVVADAENLTLMSALARSGVGVTVVPAVGCSEMRPAEGLVYRPINDVFVRRWIARPRHLIGNSAANVIIGLMDRIIQEDGPACGAIPLRAPSPAPRP